jgi:hypothetical protein
LNDFAAGPFVRAFTWCASDGKDSSRPPHGPTSFVASMTTFPSSPVTFESASSMAVGYAKPGRLTPPARRGNGRVFIAAPEHGIIVQRVRRAA